MNRLVALVVWCVPGVALAVDDGAPWLDVSIGTRLVHRELRWVDDLRHALPEYALPLGPMPTASLEVFPGAALVKDGIAGNFGLTATYGQLVGVTSIMEGSTAPARQTNASELDVGAALRWLLGPATLQLGVGWVSYRYVIDPPTDDEPAIPGVTISALRAGLRMRVRVADPLALELSGGYRHLLGTNPFGYDPAFNAYFPHATGAGADGGVGVIVVLPAGLELRLHGEWRRWWFTLNPEVGDPYVAGGALDQSFAGRASLAFRL